MATVLVSFSLRDRFKNLGCGKHTLRCLGMEADRTLVCLDWFDVKMLIPRRIYKFIAVEKHEFKVDEQGAVSVKMSDDEDSWLSLVQLMVSNSKQKLTVQLDDFM